MKIQLSDLTTERKWRAATGFDKQRFEKLLELFKKSYLKIYGKPVKERQVQTEIHYCLNSQEELLFFTLFSLKSGLTYDLLGLVCGMEASNAKRNQKTGLEVLQRIFPIRRDGHQRLSLAPRKGVPANPPARQAAHHPLPGPSDRGHAHPGGVPRRLRRRPPAFSLALHRITQARHQRLGAAPQRSGRRPR